MLSHGVAAFIYDNNNKKHNFLKVATTSTLRNKILLALLNQATFPYEQENENKSIIKLDFILKLGKHPVDFFLLYG